MYGNFRTSISINMEGHGMTTNEKHEEFLLFGFGTSDPIHRRFLRIANDEFRTSEWIEVASDTDPTAIHLHERRNQAEGQ